ncbi:hypothetical protein [Sphingomonas sp. PAMC 26621]|uniref:hypothetical protein n=1 Tax=Sphingomonas sp. PAMC 26621 TaxID=1112213 RepID=UPI0002884452|nr:hypothetical protein [Sphingomonas sp. PAMC 26621]
MDATKYVETIELADFGAEAPRRRSPAGDAATPTVPGTVAAHPLPATLSAAVNTSSILSFVDGVPPEQQADVIYSVQFAIRAASAKFDRFAKPRDWYNLFAQVLETVGWTAEQFAFAQSDQSQGEFRMDQAALAVITSIATGNQLAVLKSSIDALGKLADGSGAITIFDYHSSTDLAGNFQLGSVELGQNGTLSMAFGGFYFKTNDHRKNFLFFHWGKQEVDFWTAAEKMSFNVALYGTVRDKVKARLGAAATSYVDEIPLTS